MPAKLTHTQYINKLKAIEGKLSPVENYINSRTNIKHICDKNHIISINPNKVLMGRGCYICYEFECSEERYIEKLVEKDIIHYPTEAYINTNTPINHSSKCNHIWKVSPASILRGTGCPICCGNQLKTNEEYISSLKNRTIINIENYINDYTSIKHLCKICSFMWAAKPSDILQNKGCSRCAKTGFDISKPAYFYQVSFIIDHILYYKIGITNRTPRKRLGSDWTKFRMVLLDCVYFDIGNDAKNLESSLLIKYKEYKINTSQLTSGNTETFTHKLEILDD